MTVKFNYNLRPFNFDRRDVYTTGKKSQYDQHVMPLKDLAFNEEELQAEIERLMSEGRYEEARELQMQYATSMPSMSNAQNIGAMLGGLFSDNQGGGGQGGGGQNMGGIIQKILGAFGGS